MNTPNKIVVGMAENFHARDQARLVHKDLRPRLVADHAPRRSLAGTVRASTRGMASAERFCYPSLIGHVEPSARRHPS